MGGQTGLNTGNTVSFGTLSMGLATDSPSNTIAFTAANSYKQSYAGLKLPGSTGGTTILSGELGHGNHRYRDQPDNERDQRPLRHAATPRQHARQPDHGRDFRRHRLRRVRNFGDTRITENGSGQWILSGTNTYHGPTTLNQNAGTLQFAGNSALPSATAITGGGAAGPGYSFSAGNTPTLQIRADGTGSGSTLNLGNNITMNSSAGTTGMQIDVGSLSGAATGVTVSFGTVANGTANVTPPQGAFLFTGNNGYIAQMKVFALAGSSGATTGMQVNGNMSVVIGSPLALTATAVYSQQATPGTGFDTVNFDGTTSGTSNNGLGNVIYGIIADSPNFIQNGGWLHGEVNVNFNGIYSGQQGTVAASGGSTSLWTLSGSESYHGWTNVQGGTLQLGTGQPGQDAYLYSQGLLLNNGAVYYGNSIINWGGALIFNNYDNQTISYRIAATETNTTTSPLTKLGAGNLTLASTIAGYTQFTISAGTFQIGAGATGGSISTTTPITNNAVLSFDRPDAVVYPQAISGNGGIYQIGNGSVTMSSLANFTGTLGVNSGSMFANGATKATAITVAGGTTLGGTLSAPSAAATLNSGATLTVGNGALGSDSFSSLSFTSGGTINAGSIGNYYASAGTAAAVNIGGNLSAGGAVQLTLGGGPGPVVLGGNYQVLGYGGSLLGTGSNSFVVNSTGATGPTNYSPVITYSSSAVDVTFKVSNYPIWSGTASTTWTGANWQSSSTSTAVAYASNNLAYFGDTYPTTGGTVAVASGALSISTTVIPYSAYFANNTVPYTLTSSGGTGITGGAMLVMTGAGALTINNTNTYTGGTFLYNGLLNLGTSAALGNVASTLTLASGTLNNTSGGAMTLPNYPIVLAGNHSFLTSGDALNLGTGAVTMPVPVTLTIGGSTLTVGGVISGAGALTEAGAGTLLLNAANTFTGNTLVSGGVLMLGNASALQNSTLDTSGGGSINFGSLTAATVGGLTNGGALTLTNTAAAGVTLSVGNNSVSNTSSANINGLGGITKVGSGLQALSGNLTYSGSTNVSAGTLQFLGNLPPSGGTVGIGGGVISIANDNATAGTISVGNNITLTVGATVGIDARGLTGSNPNSIVSFGALNNGTSANALATTFNFTGANGYTQSYTGLALPGSTGNNTTLKPTTTTVIINGPVTNQITTNTASNFDTLFLQGTTLGNQINGVISDSPNSTAPGNSNTRINANGTAQWILNGANTYHGSTTITSGTLGLGANGSINNTNTIIISNGATFERLGPVRRLHAGGRHDQPDALRRRRHYRQRHRGGQ